jgi:VIT1/CCC1 family predicted Fe2+/Mn2+ transporter
VAAVVVGVVLASFTERSKLASALRQLAVTAVAAGVTYGVGKAIGTGIS